MVLALREGLSLLLSFKGQRAEKGWIHICSGPHCIIWAGCVSTGCGFLRTDS